MNDELDPQLDNEQIAAGLTIEGQLDARFEEMFMAKWNSFILPWVKNRINQEVGEAALKLGKQIGDLVGRDGKI